MAEGDSIHRLARRLDAALAGQVVRAADLRVPRHATSDLRGRRVLGVAPRGKHLLTRLEGGLTLHTHLRMQGSWRLHRTGPPRTGPPRTGPHGTGRHRHVVEAASRHWQVRVVLATDPWVAVGWDLPVVDLLPTRDEHLVVGHLGPDILGDPDTGGWDLDEALRRLRALPLRPVGEALLDQRNLAGIGNLYRVETLFLRGVRPSTPVGRVADLPALVELARRIMATAVRTGVQTTTGDVRRGQDHWVYGRAGRPCRRCAIPVAFTPAEPAQLYARESWWCPSCQPEPMPTLTP